MAQQPPTGSLGDPIDEYLDRNPISSDLHVEVTGQAPPSAPDPIDVYLDELDRRRKAGLTETLRPDVNPDQRAQDIKTSQQVGVPVSAVEHDREVMLQKARDGDPLTIQLLRTSPGLAEWLTKNPDEAGAAKDDLPAMATLENELTLGAKFLRAWDNTQASFGRFVETLGAKRMLNSKKFREYGQSVAEFNEQQSRELGKPQKGLDDIHDVSSALWTFQDAVASNSVQIALTTGGAYTGAAVGGALATAAIPFTGGLSALTVPGMMTVGGFIGAYIPSLMYGVGEVQRSIKEIDKTAEAPYWAFAGGSAIAAADALLPNMIGGRLAKWIGREGAEHVFRTTFAQALKPQILRSVTKESAKGLFLEAATEGFQRGLQDVAAAYGTGTKVDVPKTLRGMAEEAVIGGMVGSFYSGAGAAATHGAESRAYAKAQQQKVLFDALAAGATDSKLRERLGPGFQSYVAHLTKDGPLENVYVGADEFTTYWQSKNINPHVIAAQLTGNDTALAEALETGTRLVIPTAAYATHVAASPHHSWFAQELSLTPEGLNIRQAEEADAVLKQQMIDLANTVQQMAAGELAPVTAPGGPIRQDLARQLQADPGFVAMAARAGVDPGQAANTAAALNEDILTTLAGRLGIDPVTLYREGAQLQIGAQGQRLSGQVAPGEASAPGRVVRVQDPAEAFLGAPDATAAPSLTDQLSELELLEDDDESSDSSVTELSQAARLSTLREQMGDETVNAMLSAMPETPVIEGEALATGPPEARKRFPLTKVVDWLKKQNPFSMPPGPVRDAVEQAQAIATPPPEPVEVPSLLRAPMDVFEGRLRVSTRVPWAVNAPAQQRRLRTDFSVLLQSTEAYAKTAAWMRTLIQVPPEVQQGGSDEQVFEAFMARGLTNLRFLWDYMKPEWRDRAKLWYVGAHRIAHAIADEHGFTDQQAVALLAVMSPKIDWFKNVAYARAAAKFFTFAERENPVFNRTLFSHYAARMLESFDDGGVRKLKTDGYSPAEIAEKRRELKDELLDEKFFYLDLTWEQLDPDGKARLLRAYVEMHYDLNYQVIMPEGEDAGVKRNKPQGAKPPQPAKMGWTSFPITATAIAIMQDGSEANIQEQLGGEHKVRSFFNNISDPWDPDSVTIDTHAVAAVHLQPFSSNSIEVTKTMSGFGDNLLGLSGANNVYAEVYFRLAQILSAELGYTVLPREVQSVTWEAVRLLYPPEQKRGKGETAVTRAQAIWDDFVLGKITEQGLYERHASEPGRAAAPDWADHPPRVAVDEGQLRAGYGVPLVPDVPVRRGDRGGRPGGPPRRNAGLAEGDVVVYQQPQRGGAFVRSLAARADPGASAPVHARREAARSRLGDLHRTATRLYVREGRTRVEGLRGVAHKPSLQFRAAFGGLYPTPTLVELDAGPEAAALFHGAITAAKAGSRYGAAVFVYDAADYAGMRLFVSEDRKHGFAIKPDGDIVSVFSRGGGNVHAMIGLAVQEGGTKLDAFDTVLPDLYAVNGFKIISRDPWNDAYTPEGWDKATFADYNNGQPDVVYMQYDPAALETGPVTLFQSAPTVTGGQWAFSKLTRAVELSDTKKASGQQWKGIIRNAKIGINADEFLFAHVDDLENGTTYTKQEVLDYLKVNQLQIEYLVLGAVDEVAIENRTQQLYDDAVRIEIENMEAASDFESPYYQVLFDERGQTWTVYINGEQHESGIATEDEAIENAVSTVAFLEEEQAKEIRHAAESEVSWSDAREAAIDELGMQGGVSEFATYVEPGADPNTYREVFLHSPSFGTTGFTVLTKDENHLLREHGHMGTLRNITKGREDEADAIIEANEELDDTIGVIDRALKRQANFGDPTEARRLNTMRAALQKLRNASDYTYRSSGWKDGHAQYAKIENPIVRLRFNVRTLADGSKMLFLEELQPPQEHNFPKMPAILQKNWRELGFKWAIAHATAIGADSIGWTTGQMQLDRYSLEKDVESVHWQPQQEGEGGPKAEDASRRIDLILKDGEGTLKLFVDNDLNVVHALLRSSEQAQFKGRSVQQLLGKDFIETIHSQAIGSKQAKDIKVGGEGLRRLYDSDFGIVVNKLPPVKKHGGRVTTLAIPHGEAVTWEPEDQAAFTPPTPEDQLALDVADDDRWDLGEAGDEAREAAFQAGMTELRGQELAQRNAVERRARITARVQELEHERTELVLALGGAPDYEERHYAEERLTAWAEGPGGQELQQLTQALQNENLTRAVAAKTTPVPGLVLTPEIKAAVGQGQNYFQNGTPTNARGQINFAKTAAGVRLATISMLGGADISTVFHELGHLYLELLGDVTADVRLQDPTTLAPGQVSLIKDYETILNWLGVSGRQEIGTEQHEQFARGFEAYLREGKAPSVELRAAFANFRTWLVGLYRRVDELQVNLTPEVRAVFDRMVASDQAIEEARNEAQIIPFATAEQAGMTDHEFAVYRETAAKANEQAKAVLEAKLFKELQQERTAFYKARRRVVQAEVEADVWSRREQIALSILTVGKLPSGAPAPSGAENLKISKASIVERFGKDRLKVLPKPWVYAVEGGVDVETVAEVLGYASGEELLTDLAKTVKPETVVREETNARMQAEVGDIRADGTLQAAAKRAVQDHGMDAVLALELKAIARKVRQVLPFVRQKVQQGDLEARSALVGMQEALAAMASMEQVRAQAEARIAAVRVRDLRPQLYWAAAKAAGQAAFKAASTGRYELALQEKTKQRLATAMYRASSAAVEEADATARYASRFTKPGPRTKLGKAGDSYLAQVDALLDKFEFATVPLKALDKRQTLVAWVEQRTAEGYDTSGIPAELLEAARRTNYRELSVEALRQVRDAIRQVDKMAGLKTRLLANKDARDYAKVRDELVAQLEAGRKPGALPVEYRAAEQRRNSLATWFASHAKIAQLARALDAYKDGGPFWRALIRPLNDAANAEQTRRGEAGTAYAAVINAHYPGKELKTWNTKVKVSDKVGALSLEGRLAVALNWGNESSRQRLLNDPRRQWTEADIEAILDTLSQNDWLFVQKTWDFIDTFWQEISDKQQRVVGLRPQKVEALTVKTKFGPMRGGYYPLAYDSRMSARAGQVAAATEAKLATHAAYVRTTTKRGHTETRLEHVELPIRLDLGVMFNHLDQVIHDLTHHEVLIDVGRLLRDKAVSQRMIDIAGEPVYKQFTDALNDIATGGKGAANIIDRAAVFMRTGTQVVGMGYNLWTALQQPLGLFNGAARVGPSWVAKGMARWMRDAVTMENTVAWIHDVSSMMKARHNTANQDIADLRKTLQKPGGWFDTLVREVTRDKLNQQSIMDSYLWHIGLAQRVADVPTWLGGYEKAMAAGNNEERSIALADQAVLDSQGGGQIKDLAAVQRGGEVAKLFMVFYSYGNTMYNSTAEAYGKAQLKTAKGQAQFIGNLSLLYVFPAFGTATLALLMGRDDDDEPFLLSVGKEMLATALNTMVLLRELGGLVRSTTRGYEGPAGTRFLSLLYRLSGQVAQGEADEALLKALNQVAGIILKYPAGQVQRTIDGWIALEEGRTSNPFALLVGPPRE